MIKKKGGITMESNEMKKSSKKSAFAVIGALVLVVASVGYIVYRVFSDRSYNEKWKDYDECGLV